MITLYDVPSSAPRRGWSSNVWKVRLALNYKGLDYSTEWIEYPDIEKTCQAIGAPPTGTSDPKYTLPVIVDHTTNTVLSESISIVQYLDRTYPNRRVLTEPLAFHHLFRHFAVNEIFVHARKLSVRYTPSHLSPRSAEYYTSTRAIRLPNDVNASDAECDAAWTRLLGGLSKLGGLCGSHDGLSPGICYADLTIVAFLIWVQEILPPERWNGVTQADSGRWKRLFDKYNAYLQVR